MPEARRARASGRAADSAGSEMRLGWASKCPPEHEKEESDGLEPPESPVRGGVVGWRLTLLGGVGLDRVLCLPPSLLPRHGSTRGCQP